MARHSRVDCFSLQQGCEQGLCRTGPRLKVSFLFSGSGAVLINSMSRANPSADTSSLYNHDKVSSKSGPKMKLAGLL